MKNNFTIKPLKILITGKSGVGKSTFANFLFGRDVFKTDIGKPVTKGIQKKEFKINKTPIEVIDTEGLEPDNIDDIQNEIENLINNNRQLLSPIHGMFYLINAASARIEEFEIKYIKKLQRYNIPINIVLTHTDIATKEQVKSLKKVIDDNVSQAKLGINVDTIELTLVAKRFRGGKINSLTQEKLNTDRKILIETFFKIYAKYYLYYNIFELICFIKDKVRSIKNEAINKIEKSDLSIFNITEWEEKLDKLMEEADEFLNYKFKKFDYIENDFTKLFNNIANDIGVKVEDTIDFSFIDNLLDIDEDRLLKKMTTIKSFEESMENIESDETTVLQKAVSIASIGAKALRIETTLKNIVNEFYREVNLIIDEIENELKKNYK